MNKFCLLACSGMRRWIVSGGIPESSKRNKTGYVMFFKLSRNDTWVGCWCKKFVDASYYSSESVIILRTSNNNAKSIQINKILMHWQYYLEDNGYKIVSRG